MFLVGGYAVLLAATTLGVFAWTLAREGGGPGRAVTLAFMTLALGQLLHVFNARTIGPLRPIRLLFANRWIWGSLVVTVGLQLAAVYVPALQRVLNTVALTGQDWALVLGAATVPVLLGQAWKRVHAARGNAS